MKFGTIVRHVRYA